MSPAIAGELACLTHRRNVLGRVRLDGVGELLAVVDDVIERDCQRDGRRVLLKLVPVDERPLWILRQRRAPEVAEELNELPLCIVARQALFIIVEGCVLVGVENSSLCEKRK